MSLLSRIKNDVEKSGQSRGDFMYFRQGAKVRLRFLRDVDDGLEIVFHDSFELGITVPCQLQFDRPCPYCDNEELRTRSQYAWSVYDYEAKAVKIFMFPVNNWTPVPQLIAMYENYGILTDRDYVIGVSGKGTNKSYSVIPQDKVKFRNRRAKPFSDGAIWEKLDKAWPDPEGKGASRFGDDDEEKDTSEYEGLRPVELYKLCVEREIDVEPRKKAAYYINALVEYDEAQEEWGDDDDFDDEWDDEEEWDDEDEWEDDEE